MLTLSPTLPPVMPEDHVQALVLSLGMAVPQSVITGSECHNSCHHRRWGELADKGKRFPKLGDRQCHRETRGNVEVSGAPEISSSFYLLFNDQMCSYWTGHAFIFLWEWPHLVLYDGRKPQRDGDGADRCLASGMQPGLILSPLISLPRPKQCRRSTSAFIAEDPGCIWFCQCWR